MDLSNLMKKDSPYLAKEDVPNPVTLQIVNFTVETLADQSQKPCIHFPPPTKPMLLNKSNLATVVMLYSNEAAPNSDDFIGRSVTVYNDPTVEYQGRRVGGLKIQALAVPQAQPAPQPAQQPVAVQPQQPQQVPPPQL